MLDKIAREEREILELEHNNRGRKYRHPTDSTHVKGQRSCVESALEQTPSEPAFVTRTINNEWFKKRL